MRATARQCWSLAFAHVLETASSTQLLLPARAQALCGLYPRSAKPSLGSNSFVSVVCVRRALYEKASRTLGIRRGASATSCATHCSNTRKVHHARAAHVSTGVLS